MRRYTNRCEDAIRDNQSQSMVDNTSQIARLGNRVLMAAKNEADNSEEPSFVQRVNQAASQLHSGKYKSALFCFDRATRTLIFQFLLSCIFLSIFGRKILLKTQLNFMSLIFSSDFN